MKTLALRLNAARKYFNNGPFRKCPSNGRNFNTPASGISVDIKHFESAAFRHSNVNCFLIGSLDVLGYM